MRSEDPSETTACPGFIQDQSSVWDVDRHTYSPNRREFLAGTIGVGAADFGIESALVSLGVVGYHLRRRLSGEESESE